MFVSREVAWRKRYRNEQGAALVEAAAVTPILMLLLTGFVAGTVTYIGILSNIVAASSGMVNSYAFLDQYRDSRAAYQAIDLAAPSSRPEKERQQVADLVAKGTFFPFSEKSREWERLVANAIGAAVVRNPGTDFLAASENVQRRTVDLFLRDVTLVNDRTAIEATLVERSNWLKSLQPKIRLIIPRTSNAFGFTGLAGSDKGVSNDSPIDLVK